MKINTTPAQRAEYERRITEWGERGTAHNIAHTPVSPDNRTTISLGGANSNIPINSTERQKQRTFT
jgi:hypothetical protein